jgi:hypothetical protein
MPSTHATALYVFSLQRQAGLAAGKNFISLYNPLTSGKTMSMGAFFSSNISVQAGPPYPLRGYRISVEPTGGTLHATSEICAFDNQIFSPAAVIRSNDPTISAFGPSIYNAPPATQANTVQQTQQTDAPPGFNPFLIRPGEGVVMRQDVGSTGSYWNVSIVWRELKG